MVGQRRMAVKAFGAKELLVIECSIRFFEDGMSFGRD
jgi:hypothetical protein